MTPIFDQGFPDVRMVVSCGERNVCRRKSQRTKRKLVSARSGPPARLQQAAEKVRPANQDAFFSILLDSVPVQDSEVTCLGWTPKTGH
jgi:hypothetical protein